MGWTFANFHDDGKDSVSRHLLKIRKIGLATSSGHNLSIAAEIASKPLAFLLSNFLIISMILEWENVILERESCNLSSANSTSFHIEVSFYDKPVLYTRIIMTVVNLLF
jgi:hypothetical protein